MKKQQFDIEQCLVRLAKPSDNKDLTEIAKTIWDGGDYLPKVAKTWMNEPWFLVCEYQNKVIACIKLTLLPNQSLWFEGMRVHGEYQGLGIGRLMNQAAMKLASEIEPRYPKLKYEFITYRLNKETLHLTTKVGFKEVESFYSLEKHGTLSLKKPKIITKVKLDIFEHYPLYLPVGWRGIHKDPDSLHYIHKHAKLFASPKMRYLLSGHDYRDVTVLGTIPQDIRAEIPYIQFMIGYKKDFSIIFPKSQKEALPRLLDAGFKFMDDNPNQQPDMLVFSM